MGFDVSPSIQEKKTVIDKHDIADQIEQLTGYRNDRFIDHVIESIEERIGWGWPAQFEIRGSDTLSGRPEIVSATISGGKCVRV